MARITISVPDDLQKRMRRAKSLNWSAVAAAAFEAKLTEAAKAMRQQKVEEIAKSLRNRGAPASLDMTPRESLIERIESQAEWRDQKANEYQDDRRNQQSAECLRQLARHLDNIPPNDALWIRYANVWGLDEIDAAFTLGEHESEELRTYGFYGSGPAEVSPKDAIGFLKGLVEELENLAAERMVE